MRFCAYNRSRCCDDNTWSVLEEYDHGCLARAGYVVPVVYPDKFR